MMIQRSPEVSHPLKWGFIGGKIEDDEDIMQGLRRELSEEIGFIPHVSKIYPFDHFVNKIKLNNEFNRQTKRQISKDYRR